MSLALTIAFDTFYFQIDFITIVKTLRQLAIHRVEIFIKRLDAVVLRHCRCAALICSDEYISHTTNIVHVNMAVQQCANV